MFLSCTLSNPSLFSCDSVYECGNITASFPFWGEERGDPCGHPYLKLSCDRVSNKTSLTFSNISYDVHQIDNKLNTLTLARQNSSCPFCSVPFTDMKIPLELFELSPTYKNLTVFFNCDPRIRYLENFTCSEGRIGSVYQSEAYHQSCQTIFNVIAPEGYVPEEEAWNLIIGKVLVMVFKAALLLIFVGSLIASVTEFFFEKIDAFKNPMIGNFEELIPLKRYSYTEISEMTNSFAQEIGRGGFGIVYGGTIGAGLKVAVKSLFGYCFESSKQAIIYEFVENGSLDKFISGEASSIDLRKMYEISLGVARGLQYLHYACKTRIVHFDIKPQNVLLGKDLCPKISDFGLARLCGSKESVLLMSEMRGTIGYIAPEVFSRMYGRVSHKSDVYSYEMLVLEMIGARKRNSVSSNNISSMYFPDWIYKDLEKKDCKKLLIDEITEDEDEDFAKKMVLVGLSCIQACPSDRPSMNRVVEMMEGNLSALEAPPKSLLQLSASPMLPSSCPEEENSILSEVSIYTFLEYI
ncbi:Protein kinase domain [Arabidopsis suecica]|uniref:Protein kinase domain n=1 Tax=Arabidopsis suecica TaxID=45249 RepID=A0A8T1YQE8_ARASU|nr:Protein kinase domain [Arabidopsis suecica]